MHHGLVVSLALALVASPARADDGPALGGYVKTFVFAEPFDPYSLDRAGSRLQLSVRGGNGAPASYYAAVDLELDSRLLTTDAPAERGASLDVYPVEMYVNLSRGPFELRLGQQLIFWGRTAWSPPTDVISAWDYPDMASEIEDYRLAPVAARLQTYFGDEVMLDLVWLPVFLPSRVPMSTPETMGGLPVTSIGTTLPRRLPKNGELGARLSQTVSAWALDWSLAVYRGFEKLPTQVVTPVFDATSGMPTGFDWGRRFDRLTLLGGDLAKALGPVVLKAEAALKITEDDAHPWDFSERTSGNDPFVTNSRIETALGVDYVHSEDLTLAIEYQGRTLLDYDRAAERAALAALYGHAPGYVPPAQSHALLGRVMLGLTDHVGAQLVGIYSLSARDYFALGFVSWEIADALIAYLGAVGFGGADASTPYARQHDASRLFAELKLAF